MCAWLRAGASAEASAAGRGSSRGREQPWLRLIPVSFGGTGSRRRLLRGDLFPPTCSGRAVRHGAVSPGAARVSPGILRCRRRSSDPLSRRGGDGKEEASESRFRKVLLLSSKEFIFPCLLDSSSWQRGDFFFSPSSSLPLLEKLASERTCPWVFVRRCLNDLGLSPLTHEPSTQPSPTLRADGSGAVRLEMRGSRLGEDPDSMKYNL